MTCEEVLKMVQEKQPWEVTRAEAATIAVHVSKCKACKVSMRRIEKEKNKDISDTEHIKNILRAFKKAFEVVKDSEAKAIIDKGMTNG